MRLEKERAERVDGFAVLIWSNEKKGEWGDERDQRQGERKKNTKILNEKLQ